MKRVEFAINLYAKLGEYKKDYNPSDGLTKLSDYHSKYKQFDNFLNEI